MASISRVILLDMIEKQLKVQPMSRVQIMEHFGKQKTVITNCLDVLRKYKRIYICENIVVGRRITPIYKTGSLPDVIHLPQYAVRRKEKALKAEPVFVVPKVIKHHELLEWVFLCNQKQLLTQ
jgi:hypothetical protein